MLNGIDDGFEFSMAAGGMQNLEEKMEAEKMARLKMTERERQIIDKYDEMREEVQMQRELSRRGRRLTLEEDMEESGVVQQILYKRIPGSREAMSKLVQLADEIYDQRDR